MGLDFSHGEARWAYSGFMRFRSMLAETLGYDVPLHEMYGNNTHDIMKDEAIWPLINHSDCEGELTVAEMEQILPQLKAIVAAWEAGYLVTDVTSEIQRASNLIESMEFAIEDNESLGFC